ncbi:bifunctional 3-phenylpropionate/cinnamic acid dioxygenase ferredoxin subunit [Pseudonocardia xinjiangensis]|uniref:Bifunctional 3-phenylpropionate/cinnamic acid dioxygenase ferredoxin subunit n=1 Tax=Pseudonocardia xinjiangensis TaxID=75289 RepID=A0ABX1RT25_9PSEU|nr:bifunctional 3-phenylpropionate/cinnamic acid dioxygenase ferredoxin subunit [Pseudonocardia xinjiangensis]NMH82388.1 bifunctional 3-phenylpropionate/cinnamic acid dioxygenase ferredoxin subunit [Pseudonocardia xinjiangensis]
MTGAEAGWVRVCSVAELRAGEGILVRTTPPIALFRCGDRIHCIDDTCTHEDYSLAEGWVENGQVECPLHLARFDLVTGAVLSPPATRPVRVHEVRVEDGDVLVHLPPEYEIAVGRAADHE